MRGRPLYRGGSVRAASFFTGNFIFLLFLQALCSFSKAPMLTGPSASPFSVFFFFSVDLQARRVLHPVPLQRARHTAAVVVVVVAVGRRDLKKEKKARRKRPRKKNEEAPPPSLRTESKRRGARKKRTRKGGRRVEEDSSGA